MMNNASKFSALFLLTIWAYIGVGCKTSTDTTASSKSNTKKETVAKREPVAQTKPSRMIALIRALKIGGMGKLNFFEYSDMHYLWGKLSGLE